jgi:hypothetical protein
VLPEIPQGRREGGLPELFAGGVVGLRIWFDTSEIAANRNTKDHLKKICNRGLEMRWFLLPSPELDQGYAS